MQQKRSTTLQWNPMFGRVLKDLVVWSKHPEPIPKQLELVGSSVSTTSSSEKRPIARFPETTCEPWFLIFWKPFSFITRVKSTKFFNDVARLRISLIQSESKITGMERPFGKLISVKGTSKASCCSAATLWKTFSAWPTSFCASLWRAGETDDPASSTTACAVLKAEEHEALANDPGNQGRKPNQSQPGFETSKLQMSSSHWKRRKRLFEVQRLVLSARGDGKPSHKRKPNN